MKNLYSHLSKILCFSWVYVFAFTSCTNQDNKYKEAALQSFDVSIKTLKEQNNVITLSIQREAMGGYTERFQQYYTVVVKINKIVSSFEKFLKSELDIDQIKTSYRTTIDTLQKCYFECIKMPNLNSFKSRVDSTLNYYDFDDDLLKKKMVLDINQIAYEMNNSILDHSYLNSSYKLGNYLTSLSSLSAGESYYGYFIMPSLSEYAGGVVIDSIKFNNKEYVSYKLYDGVALIKFDSLLKKGSYQINGKSVLILDKWGGDTPNKTFRVMDIDNSFEVK